MMKNIVAIAVAAMLMTPPVFAFTSDVILLPKADVVKLADEKLIDAYTDVIVELEATRSFHATSGYTAKQYDEYKALLKYKILLQMEIRNRNIDAPQLER